MFWQRLRYLSTAAVHIHVCQQPERRQGVTIVPEEGRPVFMKNSVGHVGIQHFWSQDLACPPHLNKPTGQPEYGDCYPLTFASLNLEWPCHAAM